jgi:beta-fructofuranosidase
MQPAERLSYSDEAVAADPHRPLYHFLPPANWLNDPNGLIQWQGQYHLFYQYNPNGPFHGTIHWGHAVSSDLVHWRDLPIALAPTPGGPDHAGCYSGCAIKNGGVPTLIYTGIAPEVQCLATSSDDLLTWQKHPANPVIAAPPPGLDVLGFRDPYVWREGDLWYAVLGSGIREVGGTIFLYRSTDLIHWTYLQQLCTGKPSETGTMWECPNFFPLGDKHALIISPIPLRKVLYLIGTYADFTFTPERRHGVLDEGGCYYAPQVLLDDRGRRLIWGWLWEGRSAEACQQAGWNGVMSLPRLLDLGSDGSLRTAPVPELAALRTQPLQWTGLDLTPGRPLILPELRGDCLELDVTIELGAASEVAVAVRCSPDGEEQTRIVYNRPRAYLAIDRRRTSRDPTVASDERGCHLSLAADEPLNLRIFLDRSVLEVFANGRECLTSRIYPTRADSVGVELTAAGAPARLRSLAAWTMKSIWTTKAAPR